MKNPIIVVILVLVGNLLVYQVERSVIETGTIIRLQQQNASRLKTSQLKRSKALSATYKKKPIAKPTPPKKATTQRNTASTLQSYSTNGVRGIVAAAASKYGLNVDHFLSVVDCESSFNANAVNTSYYAGGGNPSGLMQFLPETWKRMSSQAGYSGASVFNPVANANVAAWAWANGHSGEWQCQ